jgi:hypothetical protein
VRQSVIHLGGRTKKENIFSYSAHQVTTCRVTSDDDFASTFAIDSITELALPELGEKERCFGA